MANDWEKKQYAPLINKILYKGQKRASRAGDVYSIFGEVIEIDLQESGFPLLQGRKMFPNGIIGELAAMLRGPKTVADFKKFGCNYWDAWGEEPGSCRFNGDEAKGGELEVDYGNAWIDFNGVNQLEDLVDKLLNKPDDRRMLITGWRPDRLPELSLPCCHLLYQWYVRDGKYLDMIWYQRSVDTMIGLPSDIVLCALWNIILAQQCGYKPGMIKLMLGDTHIYANHIAPTLDYMRQLMHTEPTLITSSLDTTATVFNFRPDMLILENYNPKPAIKFDLNV